MDFQGPHLLAPTGSDLSKYGNLNSVFAGYHYDLNFLTIHGRSRFPGLFIWLRDGRKVPVKVPEGCLLLQAGKQVCSEHFFLTFDSLTFCVFEHINGVCFIAFTARGFAYV